MILLTLIQIPLVTASFACAVQRMGAGEEVGVGDALRGGVAVFWSPALLAILLAGVFTALGFIALILPGIYLSVRLAFVGQAAAIERTGARAALRMSMRLTKGRFWSVLGILALVSFGGFIVATAVQAPFHAMGGTAELAAAAIVQSAVNWVTALALEPLVYFRPPAARRAGADGGRRRGRGLRGLVAEPRPAAGPCATLPAWSHPTPPSSVSRRRSAPCSRRPSGGTARPWSATRCGRLPSAWYRVWSRSPSATPATSCSGSSRPPRSRTCSSAPS